MSVALLAALASAPVAANAARAWTGGVRGALLAEGPTESVHRGFEGALFLDRGGDQEVTFGVEAGYLADPGGKTTPRDEITLAYGAPHVRFRLTPGLVPAFVELGLLAGQYERDAATTVFRDASGFVVGGFVGAAARYEVRPHLGVHLDGRFCRAYGSSLPAGEDKVDWWSVGLSLLTWR